MSGTAERTRPPRSVVLACGVAVVLRLHPFVVSGAQRRLVDLDTPGYLEVADGLPSVLWDGGHPGLDASLRRTPGYPSLLRLFQFWGGDIDVEWASVLGILLSGLGLVLASWMLARRLSGDRVGVVVAWAVALDVLLVSHAPFVLTDTAFALLFVLLVDRFVLLVREPTWQRGAVVGLLGATAALVRPVALYFAPVLVLAMLVARPRSDLRRAAVASVALVVATAVPLGAWVLRNAVVADLAAFTTVDGSNLFEYRAAGAVARVRGISDEEALRQLEAEYRDELQGTEVEVDAAKRRIGVRLILDHPGAYARATLDGALMMFAESGSFDLEQRLPEAIRPLAGPLLKAGAVAVALVGWSGAVLWCVAAGRDGRRADLLAVAAPVVAYLLVAVGPESYSRFRVPLQPVLIVLAVTVVLGRIDRVRGRREASRTPSPATTPTTLDHA